MSIKLFGTVASAALIMTSAQAFAATLTIDTFDGEIQRVADVPEVEGGDYSEIFDADVLGNYRELQVNTVAGNQYDIGATELLVSDSNLSFSNRDNARGTGTVTYNGQNDSGLGGVNFLIGENPFFAFEVVRFDAEVDFRVQVTDTEGNSSSYAERLTAGFNPNLSFAAFEGDADFSSVDALTFFVSSVETVISADGAIGSISIQADDVAPIPLPASGLLLLGGLGGMSLLRRRRKN